LNSAQAWAPIDLRPIGRAWRSCVDVGSNGVAPGVMRAFRFWLMVSSTAVRDTRRKSRILAHECESQADDSDIRSLTSQSGLIEAE
jgi:hypothetical protein